MKTNLLIRIHHTSGTLLILLISLPFMLGLIYFNPQIFNHVLISTSDNPSPTTSDSIQSVSLKSFTNINHNNYFFGNDGIFFSNDSLLTLNNLNKGLPSNPYDCIVNNICVDSANTLWAATNSGAYFLSKNNEWIRYRMTSADKTIHISDYKGYATIFFMPDKIIIEDLDEITEVKPQTSSVTRLTSIREIVRTIHRANYLIPYGMYIHSFFLFFSLLAIVVLTGQFLLKLYFAIWSKSTSNFRRIKYLHHWFVNLTFMISICIYLLGFLSMLMKGNSFFEKPINYSSSIKLHNAQSVEFDKRTYSYLIADDNIIFSWTPVNPKVLVKEFQFNAGLTINDINIHNNILYIATTEGLYQLNESINHQIIDTRPSYGVIITPNNQIFSTTSNGIIDINNNKLIQPSIKEYHRKSITLWQVANKLNARGSKIASLTKTSVIYHTIIIVLLTSVLIAGFAIKRKRTSTSNGKYPLSKPNIL